MSSEKKSKKKSSEDNDRLGSGSVGGTLHVNRKVKEKRRSHNSRSTTEHKTKKSKGPSFSESETIILHINKAKDLFNADVTGESDPFVTVYIGNDDYQDTEIARTKVIEDNCNPEWNQKFQILTNKNLRMWLCVWDEDMVKPDFLGYCAIDPLKHLRALPFSQSYEEEIFLGPRPGKHEKITVQGRIFLKYERYKEKTHTELSEELKKSLEQTYKEFHRKNKDGSLRHKDFERFSRYVIKLNPDERDYLSDYILKKHGLNERINIPELIQTETMESVLNPKEKNAIPLTNVSSTDKNPDVVQLDDKNLWRKLRSGARKTWKNNNSTQIVEPLLYFHPTQLFESGDHNSIEHILQQANKAECKVKAVGSGHSYSDCATTNDFLVGTNKLNKVASHKKDLAGQLDITHLKNPNHILADKVITWEDYKPIKNHALIEMECGITLKDLNVELDHRNLALMNMGGYDGQTIMGVIATSTHGSGITIGPFCDMIRSIVIATTGSWDGKDFDPRGNGVNIYRIEPTNGITDPEKYHHDRIKLVQDDDCFYATACSIGTFGVVYSVVLEVMQAYWLEENRTVIDLEEMFNILKPNPENKNHMPTIFKENRHVQFLVHPYPLKDEKEVIEFDPKNISQIHSQVKAVLITRKIVEEPRTMSHSSGHRNIFASFFQKFQLTFKVLVTLINNNPLIVPYLITSSMKSLETKGYVDRSHKVFVMGYNHDAGFAAEMAYPLEDRDQNYTDEYVQKSINRILTIAQKARVFGFQFHSSGFQVRFVHRSPCFMSMMHGRNTLIIEYDALSGSIGSHEIVKRLESEMYDLKGRPHWGLDLDWMCGSNLLEKLYPDFNKWKSFYKNFNAKGTFNNSFTNRLGLWEYNFPDKEE